VFGSSARSRIVASRRGRNRRLCPGWGSCRSGGLRYGRLAIGDLGEQWIKEGGGMRETDRLSGDVVPSLVREVAATFREASQGNVKVGNGSDSKR
jgi:hypothetical protein